MKKENQIIPNLTRKKADFSFMYVIFS